MIIADIIALPQYKSLVLDDDVNGSAPSITDLLIHRGVGMYGDHGVEHSPTNFDFISILLANNLFDLKDFQQVL